MKIAYEELFITFMFSGVVMGAALGAGGMVLKNFLHRRKWPVWAPLAIQHGKSVVWDLENRGQLVTREDGTEAMLLSREKDMGKNKAIKVPKYSQFSVSKKGQAVYPLYKTTTGQYFPIGMTRLDDTHISMDVVEDKSAKNWAMSEHNRLMFAYGPKESMWIRMMPYLMGGLFAGVIIFFIVYYGGVLTNLGNSVSSASAALTEALRAYQRPP